MLKIAFDVMGAEKGIEPPIVAINEFLSQTKDTKFILVGDEKLILRYLDPKYKDNVKIVHEPGVVSKEAGLTAGRRLATSMKTAITLVADKKADVVISAGDSGMYITLATLILKRIKNVKRAAFMAIAPTIEKGKSFLFLDVGANLEVSSEMLIQWAEIGAIFAKNLNNIKSPKVAIINIGEEDNKGFDFQIKANEFLKSRKTSSFTYKGFIEPRDLFINKIDVAVCDGYTGNIVLKTFEGAGIALNTVLKANLTATPIAKIGGLLVKKALKNAKDTFDYRQYGGTVIIGLKSIAIKAHGASDQIAFLNSFYLAKKSLENNFHDEISKKLSD